MPQSYYPGSELDWVDHTQTGSLITKKQNKDEVHTSKTSGTFTTDRTSGPSILPDVIANNAFSAYDIMLDQREQQRSSKYSDSRSFTETSGDESQSDLD